MPAMSARLKADAGSRDAAREMYQRLGEISDDTTVKEMVVAQLMRLDWLEDRDNLRHLLRWAKSKNTHPRSLSFIVAGILANNRYGIQRCGSSKHAFAN